MVFTSFSEVSGYWDSIINYFFARFIVAVIIILIGFIIGRILGRLTHKFLKEIELNNILKKANINLKIEELISHFVTYFIYFVTVIWALNEMGLTTTILNMISAAALIIIIISILLAIKDFIPNAFAGFRIFRKERIKEGSKVVVDNIEGKVKKISLLETIIETKKGDKIHIPNATLFKKELIIKK